MWKVFLGGSTVKNNDSYHQRALWIFSKNKYISTIIKTVYKSSYIIIDNWFLVLLFKTDNRLYLRTLEFELYILWMISHLNIRLVLSTNCIILLAKTFTASLPSRPVPGSLFIQNILKYYLIWLTFEGSVGKIWHIKTRNTG